jgi:hypothetical protein
MDEVKMMSMNGPEVFEYTIQADDTLWDIADDLDVSVEEIMAVNANLDPNNLYAGQVIYLPNNSQIEASQRRPGRGPGRGPGRYPYRYGRRRYPYEYYGRPPYYPYQPYYPYPYYPY